VERAGKKSGKKYKITAIFADVERYTFANTLLKEQAKYWLRQNRFYKI
jgi:hypothetical protein